MTCQCSFLQRLTSQRLLNCSRFSLPSHVYQIKWLQCLLWCRTQVDSWACNSSVQRNHEGIRLWLDSCFGNCRGRSRCQSLLSHLPVICYHFVTNRYYWNSSAKLKGCPWSSPCRPQGKMSWLSSNVNVCCFAKSATGMTFPLAKRQWYLKLPQHFWYSILWCMWCQLENYSS